MNNILFVALSEKMVDLALQVIAKMNLDIPVIVSSEAESEEVVKRYPNIEIFISRGRAAASLQKFSRKSAVELTSSIADIMEPTQKLTADGIRKIAVMASPFLIGDENYDFKLGDTEIFIRPHEKDNVEKLFIGLQKQGIKGVVAGALAYKLARQYGMKAELLETEEQSIKSAVNDAVKIAKAQAYERSREREKAEKIRSCALELYDAIKQASAAVEELSSSSQELASTSQETANVASKAFEEVNNTTRILEIIRLVAKQTNLLGINAAIEASRAGEQGRGFSVVASEVRKLAEESNRSAHEIKHMLTEFRESVEAVLKNVEQGKIITQEQAKANQSIAHMLDSLNGICDKLMNMV